MNVLPDVADDYYDKGARFVVVLLATMAGGVPTKQYCQEYAEQSGFDAGDPRVRFVLDPTGVTKPFYDGFQVTSLAVLTDRFGKIVFKEQFNTAKVFQYHIYLEIERMFDELARGE